MSRALIFAVCGGDVVYRATHVMRDSDVRFLCEILWDEIQAAREALDYRTENGASDLLSQILDAHHRALRARQSSGPYLPDGPSRSAPKSANPITVEHGK